MEKIKMGWKGLERDALDFILTDLLPVELSDRFTFYYLYEYLQSDPIRKVLSNLVDKTKKEKSCSPSTKLFENDWATQPLKYPILKGLGTYREMSLVQPFSALNIYFFIQCYQKEILHYFEKNHLFSIRYHKNNPELSYKSSQKKITKYFLKSSQELKKIIIQQAGNYFKVFPFTSINGFTDSQHWRINNLKFKYFAKIDYKSCFDSIYSHIYSRIIERNLVDAKNAKNSNLFIEIDRILQNINGRSSNGILVGPEFSRMIAEILLQHIDNQVYEILKNNGKERKFDYQIFRYVDDIFIFANDKNCIDLIIETYQSISSQYRLNINELKKFIDETPCLPKDWLEKTRTLTDKISEIFFQGSQNEYEALPETSKNIVLKINSIERIKDEITVLMKKYASERRTIVSFLLSTLLNNISKRKTGYKLFNESKIVKHSIAVIDLILFIYAFFPAFEQTEKVIAMLTYIDQEVNFNDLNLIDIEHKRSKLNKLFRKYSFIFENGNLHDLCDWFPFFYEKQIFFTPQCEDILFNKAKTLNDPIIFGNLLIYAQYNDRLKNNWLSSIEKIINRNLVQIGKKNIVEYREFWYILVFFNCPFIKKDIRNSLERHLVEFKESLQNKTTNTNARLHLLLCDFLLDNSNKIPSGFFDWSKVKKFGERITFRTYKRTVFKRYKKRSYGLYVSLD